jgi:hypothetical protein
MTEEEWLACEDPQAMLGFLGGRASDRKLRLFGCGCIRRVLHLLAAEAACRRTVEFAERFADGLATRRDLHGRAWGPPGEAFSVVLWKAPEAAQSAAEFGAVRVKLAAVGDSRPGDAAATLRLFLAAELMSPEELARAEAAYEDERLAQARLARDVFGNPFRPVTIMPALLSPTVTGLAAVAYEQRALPSGHLDPARLAVLADALEDAGCADPDLLGHLRSPGPHVRGCWALDLILCKE